MLRCAFYVALGQEYENHSNALEILNAKSLEERRRKLCENVSRKIVKQSKYQKWFCKIDNDENCRRTRRKNWEINSKYHPVKFRTERFRKSPLVYLSELLNDMDCK